MIKIAIAIGLSTALLSGCTDSFFGCPNRLVAVARSPDNKYEAITRECGCKAQAGTYLITAIVKQRPLVDCSNLDKLAIARVITETSDRKNDPQSPILASWGSDGNLNVRLGKLQKYDLRNDPIFSDSKPLDQQPPEVQAKYMHAPKISLVNDL